MSELSRPAASPRDRDEIERRLVRIWEEVLEVSPVSVSQNFYDQGGDSLRAVELALEVQRSFGVELPIRVVFQGTTIAEIVSILEAAISTRDDQNRPIKQVRK